MGVDGWKGGWVAVVLEDGRYVASGSAAQLKGLLGCFSPLEAVGVDMPIGFPTAEARRADIDARAFVGERRSSVFPMLPRAVYETETYDKGSQIARELWGRGISRQSYALKAKILEVDALVATDNRLSETHPEVCFAAMAGETLRWPKKSWNGQLLRRRLLAENGIVLPEDLGEAGATPVDDVLDAAACAWSADRIRQGLVKTLPADPAPGDQPPAGRCARKRCSTNTLAAVATQSDGSDSELS